MMRFGISEFYNRIGAGGLCRGIGGHFGGIGMIIGGVIFLALVVLFVVLIVKMAHRGRMHHQMGSYANNTAVKPENPEASSSVAGALSLLNERYAKGEINQEEYLAKKADLLK